VRREFHPLLRTFMRQDDSIWVVTADLGYRMLDDIAKEFPDRFVNVGVSEQLMLGVGIGLAEQGKIPVCYSISSFLLKRPFEWIDNYVNHEGVCARLLGGGRNSDYHIDGYSHDCSMDKAILSLWPNIVGFWPESVEELPRVTEEWLYNEKPSYLNLKR